MQFLVTGANGFIGQALCQHLRARGQAVRSAVRDGVAATPADDCVAVGAIHRATDWTAALQDCEVVVHLAALAHQPLTPDAAAQLRVVNVEGSMSLARQAAAMGVRRLVFLSSIKACTESTLPARAASEADTCAPQDAYGESKLAAEQALHCIARDTGLELVVIRPPLVYGPGAKANFAKLVRAVLRGWPLPIGAIDNRRSLLGRDNLVDFITVCATHPQAAHQTFHVSDGADLSSVALVRTIAQAGGVQPCLWAVPLPVLRGLARLTGKSSQLQSLTGNLQLDIRKAQSLLDWSAPIGVEEGIRRALQGNRPC